MGGYLIYVWIRDEFAGWIHKGPEALQECKYPPRLV